jgi:hypothetical protein
MAAPILAIALIVLFIIGAAGAAYADLKMRGF